MSLVTPMQGERRILELIIGQELTLRLFINDHEPGRGDSPNDLVELPGRYGVKRKALDPSMWTVVEGADGQPSYATYPKQTFEFQSVPIDIYGYFVQEETGEIVMWAERFHDAPWRMKMAGDRGNVTPRFEIGSPTADATS